MPSKIFDQLDLINVVEGYTDGPHTTNGVVNLNNVSYGEFSFLATCSDGPVTSATVQYEFTYAKNAEIDFTIFPTIPDGSMITRALVTLSFSIVALGDASHVAGGGGFQNDAAIINFFPNNGDLPLTGTSTAGPVSISTGFSASNTPIMDLTFDPPLSLADFIATYATILPAINTQDTHGTASSGNSGGATGSCSASINWAVSDWKCEVFYNESEFKFNIDTESPVDVGQDILLSTDDKTIDMRKITHVIVDYTTLDNVDHEVDITDFDTTQFTLIFQMIDFGDSPRVTIKLQGTQFSGSVTLGSLLTIRFNDGTGIYKLDLTATHDTLYIQDYTPVQTIDTKIPNPFAKTAFVP